MLLVPDTIGTGAIQVLFAGRLERPEIILLADELVIDLWEAAVDATDDAKRDDGDDRLSPLPPPQENTIKQLVIKIIFRTQLCIRSTSWPSMASP